MLSERAEGWPCKPGSSLGADGFRSRRDEDITPYRDDLLRRTESIRIEFGNFAKSHVAQTWHAFSLGLRRDLRNDLNQT